MLFATAFNFESSLHLLCWQEDKWLWVPGIVSVLKVHAGVVGQLAALLVPGAGHSAEVVQDAAAAMTPGHEGGGTGPAS